MTLASSDTPTPISDSRQYAVNFYVGKGLTEPQARGIVKWMHNVESGLNPTAYNPSGGGQGALGVAQWRGSRQAALLQRPDANTLHGQLEFSWDELNGPERPALEAIKRSSTEGEAFEAFGRHFERPGPTASGGGGSGRSSPSLMTSLGSYSENPYYYPGGPSFLSPEEPSRRRTSLTATTEPDQTTLPPTVQSAPVEAPTQQASVAPIRRPTIPQVGSLASSYQRALSSILAKL